MGWGVGGVWRIDPPPARPGCLGGGFLEGGCLEGGCLEGGCLDGGCLEGGCLEGGCLEGGCLDPHPARPDGRAARPAPPGGAVVGVEGGSARFVI